MPDPQQFLGKLEVRRSTLPPHWRAMDDVYIRDWFRTQLLATSYEITEPMRFLDRMHLISAVEIIVVDDLDRRFPIVYDPKLADINSPGVPEYLKMDYEFFHKKAKKPFFSTDEQQNHGTRVFAAAKNILKAEKEFRHALSNPLSSFGSDGKRYRV